jgi:hypothetical protein
MLEPCDAKVSSTVLRGLGDRKVARLLGNSAGEGGAGCPINFSMFYCTPSPVPSLPACEPNFLDCS